MTVPFLCSLDIAILKDFHGIVKDPMPPTFSSLCCTMLFFSFLLNLALFTFKQVFPNHTSTNCAPISLTLQISYYFTIPKRRPHLATFFGIKTSPTRPNLVNNFQRSEILTSSRKFVQKWCGCIVDII